MSTLHCFCSGELLRDPERKTSSNGNPFVSALLRVDTDMVLSLTAFDTTVADRLASLKKGSALSILASNRAEAWAAICAALVMGVRYTPLQVSGALAVEPLLNVGVTPGLRRESQPVRVLHNGRFSLPAGRYRVAVTWADRDPLPARARYLDAKIRRDLAIDPLTNDIEIPIRLLTGVDAILQGGGGVERHTGLLRERWMESLL